MLKYTEQAKDWPTVLSRIHNILSMGWCQDVVAVNKAGKPVLMSDADIVACDLYGAYILANPIPALFNPADLLNWLDVPYASLTDYNDHRDTHLEDILSHLHKAQERSTYDIANSKTT